MSEHVRISEAEWSVMEALWQRQPRSAEEVIQAVAPGRDWNERTVKTLLGRLVKKGALHYDQDGRRYLYRPAIAREACLRQESDNFIERCFGGRTAPAVAHFVRQGGLSKAEIAELRRLLDEEAD